VKAKCAIYIYMREEIYQPRGFESRYDLTKYRSYDLVVMILVFEHMRAAIQRPDSRVHFS